MSFSGTVKEELARHISNSRHCGIAELAAAIIYAGQILENDGNYSIEFNTENIAVARKYFTLLKKTFNINTEFLVRKNDYPRKGRSCVMVIDEADKALDILRTLKFLDGDNHLRKDYKIVNGLLIQKICCKRAFIRGAFLSSGSISDPEKSYHFEIVNDSEQEAEALQSIISSFDIDARIIQRKKDWVVYIKESEQIVEVLNVMEAHVALMELENVRILKGMRNEVNRRVNCETANLNKVIKSAVKQKRDIELIEKVIGLHNLPDPLREVAEIRLKYPEIGLKEVGQLLDPPCGKSGINHRFRKIGEMAQEIRDSQPDMAEEDKGNG